MSRRKHVALNSLQQDIQPPGEGQHIARAQGTRGGNIVEIEFADGRTSLAIMPARFIKKLWVRRGGYLIVEDSAEADGEAKVTATIVAVLYEEHIRELKKLPGIWPQEFASEEATDADKASRTGGLPKECLPPSTSEDEASDHDDGLPPLECIQNRKIVYHDVSDSEDGSDEEG